MSSIDTLNALLSGRAFRLRRAAPADAAALATLARQTFSETFKGTCTDDDLASFLDEFYTESTFGACLIDPVVQIWLAETGGIIAGYMQCAESPVPFQNEGGRALELQRLYLKKEHHGGGMAAALMDKYIQLAADSGAVLLWLGVWEHNLRAQAFYRKWKFSPTGFTHPFPIGNTPQTDEWWSRIV